MGVKQVNITIVGTGTAAWISAFVLSHTTNHKINIIEAVGVPIIGVGEGSTNIFFELINGHFFRTDINTDEFINALDITPKLAIDFKNWTSNNYYSPIDGTPTAFQLKDSLFLEALAKDKNKYHIASQSGYCVENNKMFGGAFHFDTTKVDRFLRPYCETKGVKVISGAVDGVVFNDLGYIKQLVLKDKTQIDTDFVIDATGFHRAVLKHLDYKWKDYVDNLPMNRAIPFHFKYEDLTETEFNEVKAVTTAQAMNAGWLWKIPTTKRIGCGYVFSDEFLSDNKAREEINKLYGKEIETANAIPFRSGRLEKQLIKNCLAVGLSGAFAEPLQATSIHTTIVQILTFAQSYCVEHLNDKMRNQFNNKMATLYDDMRDFLVLHYSNDRTDTKFWKMISEHNHLTPLVKEMIEYSKKAIPNFNTMNVYFGHVNHQLWNWTLAGLGHITSNQAKKELKNYSFKISLEEQTNHYKNMTRESLSFQKLLKEKI